MKLKSLIPIIIVFMVLVILSTYSIVDAFKHMEQSMDLQKEFKPFCGGAEAVNCTTIALRNIYVSMQHLLIAIIELLVSAIFAILAIYILFAMIKIWIDLNY